MIRINLMGIPKKVAKQAGPSFSMEGAKLTGLLVAFLVIGAAVVYGHYSMLEKEHDKLQEELAKQQKEKTRLAGVKAEVDLFEKRNAELQRQKDNIEKLKKDQTGPVTMLTSLADQVVSSDQLWLTSFENDGNKISLEGVAGSVNTVADFIAKLKRSGQFKNVEIKESYQDDRFKDLPTFVFSITAEVAGPAPASSKT